MRQFKLLLFFLAVFLAVGTTQVFAYDQYGLSMNVGETKTFYFPSEVTSRSSTMFNYTCWSNRSSNIEVVSYTTSSVTVRAREYTMYTVVIFFEYWYIENGQNKHDTHGLHIDLKKTGTDDGGGSNPDPTPGSDYKDGSRFYYTSNGVSMQYKVISAANKTCMVGAGSAEDRDLAVPKSTNISSLTIPSTANGFKVVEVADCAFFECKNIKKIVLPETIERIGNNAFQYCTGLTSITIPNSVTEIIDGAFSLCNNLEEVIIGESVEWIGYGTFWNDKKLKTITVLATNPPSLNSDAFFGAEDVFKNATLYVPEGCVSKYKEANTWNQFIHIEKIGGGSDEPEGIAIDATNFPDTNFRSYLLEQSYGKDGVLTESEIKGITSIYVSYENISSLKGIEYFTALTSLYCYSNQLTALDVSSNTALTSLSCSSNQLTSLDVSGCTALTTLSCYNNQLTALDVSGCTALTSLSCDGNQLTALDVSGCTALSTLSCQDNQLTSLDVSKNAALTALYCYSNQLTTLDMSGCTALTTLSCYNNQLTALDVSSKTALTSLYCYSNQLTTLDVSGCTALTYLFCSFNQLIALDVSKNVALDNLLCSGNQLTALDVTKNTLLEYLDCATNQLKTLDVSTNTSLNRLNCGGNQLTALDVSKNTALAHLTCHNNVIRGTAMDNLINSLPQNMTNVEYAIYIYRTMDGNTGNICTKKQVAAAKAKGWTPKYYNGTEWVEYEGSDDEPTSIALPEIESVEINSTIQLTPTIEPADATTELTWSSSAENIAMVTSTGKVLGVSAGAAIITVRTSNGLSAECFVIVQDTSGIENVKTDGSNASVYNLSGQKVTDTTKKGIYIINGKKVVVK